MAPAPTLQELIETVRNDSTEATPLVELSTAATVVSDVNEVSDATLGFFVDQARRAGHSWSQIGDALGVSKQAAQQRHQRSNATVSFPSSERLTDRARRAVDASILAARELGHSYVGTEHLLLGLYSEPDGVGALVLEGAGLSGTDARTAVSALVPDGRGAPEGALPFTPRSVEVFTGAEGRALQLGHNYIGTEHLLLAVGDGDGVAARVLQQAGVTPEAMLDAVTARLAGYSRKGGGSD